jgi:predicted SAM-dependent methyltransferase
MRLHRRILNAVFSPGFLMHWRMERTLLMMRLRCFSPMNLARLAKIRRLNDLKLEIGSSNDRNLPGWVGLDLAHFQNGFRWDMRWGLPLKDGSAARLHTEHNLDYVEYPAEIEAVVRECYRILKPGGVLRIVLTDAGKYLRAYAAGDHEHFRSLAGLGGADPPMETEIEVINQAFRLAEEHRFTYDVKTLERVLRRAGFADIRETGYDPDRHVDRPDWWRMKESFYLEVVK